MKKQSKGQNKSTKHTTREHCILAAAGKLFIRYGFNKTTVEEIAREAGISKGAVYLHFKGKEHLLEGVLIHEMKAFGEKWLELVEVDPQGGTIGAMYKNTLYALESSPFMAAIFKQDGRIFGNYLRKPDNFFKKMEAGRGVSTRFEFVKRMQEAGAVRNDIDAKVIAHFMNMVAFGLIGMDGVVPRDEIPETGELIHGIALLMETALTPKSGGNPQAGKTILKQIAEAGRQEFAKQDTLKNMGNT